MDKPEKPVYRRVWFWLAVAVPILFLAAAVILTAVICAMPGRTNSPSAILRRNAPLFEQTVRELLYIDGETDLEIPGVTDISLYGVGDETIVQFTTGTKIGLFEPEIQGVYYSVGGGPAAYRNWDYELIYDESDGGWNWYSESGESYGHTRHVAALNNWYWFSAYIS